MTKKLRAGDMIFHKPTGRLLTVARDAVRGRVHCCGYPVIVADIRDCVTIRAATDQLWAQYRRWVKRIDEVHADGRLNRARKKRGLSALQMTEASEWT